MAYRLLYHPAVLREDISKIQPDAKIRIREVIESRLLENPVLAGRPLRQSLKGHRKLRIGDWRVIYRIDKNSVIILKIGESQGGL